jgi:hypothetical protein
MSVIEFPEKSTRNLVGGITGRDGYLVLQSLGYAIVTIEKLPRKQQEWTNKEQMKTLLHVWSEGRSDYFLDNARHHIDWGPRSASSAMTDVLDLQCNCRLCAMHD